MANDLVSIIMLSRNDVAHVEESVRSILAHVNYKEMRKCCWPCYLNLPDG